MSALPIRERILQALATRINAQRGLEQYDARDLPITVLVEGEDTAQESDYDRTNVTLPITVAYANNASGTKSDTWYAQANTALANLIQSVYAGDESLGGLVQGIDYTGGDVAVLTDGATGYAVQAFFNIRYAFVHGNPFLTEEE